jgi:hypothetical protein
VIAGLILCDAHLRPCTYKHTTHTHIRTHIRAHTHFHTHTRMHTGGAWQCACMARLRQHCPADRLWCRRFGHDGAQRTGVVCGGHQHVCVLTFVPRWSATHRCGVRGTSACVLTFAPRWSAAHRCGVRGTPAFVCADVCNTCVHTCLCVVSQGRWSQVWRQPWPRGRWVRRDKLACVCVCFYVCDTCVHTCLCDVVKAGGVKCMTAGMAPDRWVRWQRQLCKKLRTYGIHCVHVPHVCIRTLCMHTYSLCTSVLFVCYVLHVCVCTPTPCVHTYSMCTYILLM